MNEEREKRTVPIACSLTAQQLAEMRDGLLPGLLSKAGAKESIRDGFRWRFDPMPGLLKEIGAVIDAEHRCCPFLRFLLVVEPGDVPATLEVTGPNGTEEFLSTLLGEQ